MTSAVASVLCQNRTREITENRRDEQNHSECRDLELLGKVPQPGETSDSPLTLQMHSAKIFEKKMVIAKESSLLTSPLVGRGVTSCLGFSCLLSFLQLRLLSITVL